MWTNKLCVRIQINCTYFRTRTTIKLSLAVIKAMMRRVICHHKLLEFNMYNFSCLQYAWYSRRSVPAIRIFFRTCLGSFLVEVYCELPVSSYTLLLKELWLYILIMSRTRFRVNPQSVVAWMSRNSLL